MSWSYALNVSFYVRPWSFEYFKYVAKKALGKHTVGFVSDFKGVCEGDLSDEFYKTFQEWDGCVPSELDALILRDIISRDRMLREMPESMALKLVVSGYQSILSYFESFKPDVVISVTVDSYIIDLFKFMCLKRGVEFFGIHLTMIKDYTLITSRGELNNFRSVEQVELETVYGTVSSSEYSVSYVDNKNPSFYVGFKRWFRSLIKIPFFEIIRRLRKDKLNYHYLATIAVSKQRISPQFLFFKKYFDSNWGRILQKQHTKLYMPIQFHPECNSEYWSSLQEFLPYEESFLLVVKALSAKYHILIKEHPEMIGLRNPMFYEELNRCDNVTFVPVGVSQEKLIDICCASITWNSSVGIESILRGKPVITFANPFYAIGKGYLNIKVKDGMLELIDGFLSSNIEISPDDKKLVIRKILSTSISGHPNECSFDLNDDNKKRDADNLANSLELYFDDWYEWAKNHVIQIDNIYNAG